MMNLMVILELERVTVVTPVGVEWIEKLSICYHFLFYHHEQRFNHLFSSPFPTPIHRAHPGELPVSTCLIRRRGKAVALAQGAGEGGEVDAVTTFVRIHSVPLSPYPPRP